MEKFNKLSSSEKPTVAETITMLYGEKYKPPPNELCHFLESTFLVQTLPASS
jgi:hypothetical protein